MGEWTQFRTGDTAPNDGEYIETGENASRHQGINNPKNIFLKKGESFPESSNHNRKWVRKNQV
jgi:hypothetical protein